MMSASPIPITGASMSRPIVLLTALVIAGCGLDQDRPKKEEPDREKPAEKPAEKQKQESKPRKEVEGVHDTYGLWEVYASDAVLWRDRYAGRRVQLAMRPPHEIKRRDERFYVLQGYYNGRRHEGVPIYLRDQDAERLSRISRGEEKLGRGQSMLLRVVIDDTNFSFSDAELIISSEKP